MKFSEVANILIPGFIYLTKKQKQDFINTEPGQKFRTYVEEHRALGKPLNDHTPPSERATYLAIKALHENRKTILSEIYTTDAYKKLTENIMAAAPDFIKIAELIIAGYLYLSEDDRRAFLRLKDGKAFSQLVQATMLDKRNSKEQAYLDRFKQGRETLLKTLKWPDKFKALQNKRTENIRKFNEIADQLIPGYIHLTEDQQIKFLTTQVGIEFSKLVKFVITEVEDYNSWFRLSILTKWKNDYLADYQRISGAVLADLKHTREYATITTYIAFNLLQKHSIPEDDQTFIALPFRPTEESEAFSQCKRAIIDARVDLSNVLASTYTDPKYAVNPFTDPLTGERQNPFTIDKNKKIGYWQDKTHRALTKFDLKKIIATQKKIFLDKRKERFSAVFPLRYYRKNREPGVVVDASALPQNMREQDSLFQTEMESLLLFCIEQTVDSSTYEMEGVRLFDKEMVRLFAEQILYRFSERENEATFVFREDSSLNFDTMLETYGKSLSANLAQQLPLINGKPWPAPTKRIEKDLKKRPLSVIWDLFKWEENYTAQPGIREIFNYFNEIADAHGFIQATGFSTQNENSLLSILDIINYHRYGENIAEAKSVFAGLWTLIRPLSDEFRNLVCYGQSPWRMAFRAMIPIFIIAGVIYLTALLLIPAALPEIAITVILIPAILTALLVASLYTVVKNRLYTFLYNRYWGGPYKIPEFQVEKNEKMRLSFGSTEAAKLIRAFYVEELEECDKIEAAFAAKSKTNEMTVAENLIRQNNIRKKFALCLEWYDIHSSEKVFVDDTPQIVLKRLEKSGIEHNTSLLKMLEDKPAEAAIYKYAAEVAGGVKTVLDTHKKPPSSEVATPLIRAPGRCGLFAHLPKVQETKKRLEKIAQLTTVCETAHRKFVAL